MPPKNAGQKRKRLTPEERRQKIAASKQKIADEKAAKAAEQEAEASSEEAQTPSKRRKITKGEEKKKTTANRQKPSSAASTPPRPTASSKKKPSGAPFNSPKPVAPRSSAKAKLPPAAVKAPNDEEDEEAVPLPGNDLPEKSLEVDKSQASSDSAVVAKQEAVVGTAKRGSEQDTNEGQDAVEDDETEDDDYASENDEFSDDEDDDDAGHSDLLGQKLDKLQEGSTLDRASTGKLAQSITWVFVVLSLGAMAFYFVPGFRTLVEGLLKTGPPESVCFRDSVDIEYENTGEMASHCVERQEVSISWVDCPQNAVCRAGVLMECPKGYEPSSEDCVLTAASTESLEAIVRLLQEWTALDICKGHPERFPEYGFGRRPLFHFSRVTGEIERGYNLGLVKAANHSRFLLHSSKDKNLWIGLHPSVHVPVSYVCTLKLGLNRLIGVCVFIIWTIFACAIYAAKLYASAFLDEPLYVGGTTLGCACVTYVYIKKNKEAKAELLLKNDVLACRDLFFRHLADSTSRGLKIEDLIDKVKWSRYPMSRKDRARLQSIVMPIVIPELRSDPRVRISKRVTEGKLQEFWHVKENQQQRTVQFSHSGN